MKKNNSTSNDSESPSERKNRELMEKGIKFFKDIKDDLFFVIGADSIEKEEEKYESSDESKFKDFQEIPLKQSKTEEVSKNYLSESENDITPENFNSIKIDSLFKPGIVTIEDCGEINSSLEENKRLNPQAFDEMEESVLYVSQEIHALQNLTQ